LAPGSEGGSRPKAVIPVNDEGEIVHAARANYRRQLEREPWLIEQMIEVGRGREVVEAGRDPCANRRRERIGNFRQLY
jgi:hypothetical protein